MRRFILITLSLSLLVACGQHNDGDTPETKGKQKKISKRDYSITKENSYSDLFLDSLRMETFIAADSIPDSIARRIRSFYNTRNYQYAWFNSTGPTEQALGFWNLFDYYISYGKDSTLETEKKFHNKMEALLGSGTLKIAETDKGYQQTELELTKRLIEYSIRTFLQDKQVKRKELERFVPFKKRDVMEITDSLINKKHKDNKYFDDVNENYAKLKDKLEQYETIAEKGGWPQLSTNIKNIKPGSQSAEILALKRRLIASGQLDASDTTAVFTPQLEQAIKLAQQSFGMKADGVVSKELIASLNVPVKERMKQILINLNRMRWMPTRPTGELILVNIPEFVMHIFENGNPKYDIDVVVGKEGHNTVMFTGELNQVVFSPYWNVPPSIVKNEILPAMERGPSYLERNNMEQNGTEGGLPRIRQKPGAGNSLGAVKFLFPNRFNIYFHDTPAKSLFNRDKRAFSHGCIRVAEPAKLANYLLRKQPEWTPEKINAAMHAGTEQFVKLKQPVPVFITYYTAWVDDNGLLNFRDDIYGHDVEVGKRMFIDGYK